MNRRLIDDCFLSDKDRLTHNEALEILKSNVAPLTDVQTIQLDNALNRVLGEDVIAPRAIPAHNNAAVDGYSFCYKDYHNKGDVNFLLHGRVTAGEPELHDIPKSCATRIFTGAVMPAGHDTVVMQEDVQIKENQSGNDKVIIPAGLKPSANCRKAGEDTREGDILAAKGEKLKPQHIAAIASGGYDAVKAFKPLEIAYFSTGDEIIRPGEIFQLGKVFDANAPMLSALTADPAHLVSDLGVLKDDAEIVQSALKEAAKSKHVLITSGGASKGEEDHIVSSLSKLGSSHLWQLAIKPGRPMTFGQINDTIFIGLPGNPVAAFVCYLLYVTPLLRRLSGSTWFEPRRFQIPANFEIKSKKPDRREFLRAKIISENGKLTAQKFGQDGSGLIRSITQSEGLIELEETITSINKGDLVPVIPYSEFGI